MLHLLVYHEFFLYAHTVMFFFYPVNSSNKFAFDGLTVGTICSGQRTGNSSRGGHRAVEKVKVSTTLTRPTGHPVVCVVHLGAWRTAWKAFLCEVIGLIMERIRKKLGIFMGIPEITGFL